jgi:glutathione S-transferase
LDNHLSKNEFLTDEFSIADIANWCWVRTYKWSGIDFTDLNHLSRWMKQIYSIKGMSEGLDVPISQEDLKKYYESKIGRGGNNIVIK